MTPLTVIGDGVVFRLAAHNCPMPDEHDPRVVDIGDGRSGAGSPAVAGHRPTRVVDQIGYRRTLVGVLIVTMAVVLGFLAGKATGSGAPAAKIVRQVTATRTIDVPVTATQTVVRQVTAPAPTPSAGPFNQLIGTGARCSLQKGHQLALGDEVRNGLAGPVTLIGVRVPYAAGDELRPVGSVRGPCGQLPGADNSIAGYHLPVGASVWLTVTVDVLTSCPAALHLTILLDYTQNGHAGTAMLADFPDLGDVPYTGCH
jgi:hypothetical protein